MTLGPTVPFITGRESERLLLGSAKVTVSAGGVAVLRLFMGDLFCSMAVRSRAARAAYRALQNKPIGQN